MLCGMLSAFYRWHLLDLTHICRTQNIFLLNKFLSPYVVIIVGEKILFVTRQISFFWTFRVQKNIFIYKVQSF